MFFLSWDRLLVSAGRGRRRCRPSTCRHWRGEATGAAPAPTARASSSPETCPSASPSAAPSPSPSPRSASPSPSSSCAEIQRRKSQLHVNYSRAPPSTAYCILLRGS